MVSAGPNHIMDYISAVLYFLYYAIGFYTQLVVNSEFRNEFLRMLNLTAMSSPGRADAYMNRLEQTNAFSINNIS